MLRLSLITATYNAAKNLPFLVESLLNQSDMDFEWVVADGGSNDQTLSYLKGISGINLLLSEQQDFGIYDALNRAIALSSGDYYIVLGADDRLYSHAVQAFKLAASKSHYDIVTARVDSDYGVMRAGSGKPCVRGQLAYISNHSVGTMIKKNLHDRFGYYSRRFPITADQYFIKRVCDAEDTLIHQADFVAGYYPTTGVSGADIPGTMTEFFRVQLETERYPVLQILLFIARLIRHMPKLIRYAKNKQMDKF
ncbi:glycosyltransferase [Methylobacillus flagellatus]|uniref:glycosyltransferase n=1 Tax=Methylobacillus flagellatus TaxID=405 RepID=UPI0028538975|nr:glycosyltransferase [Methylobacillus flagellatus]MDR5171224.1 glycosyltransferase [Methylobacillus flagellatus]